MVNLSKYSSIFINSSKLLTAQEVKSLKTMFTNKSITQGESIPDNSLIISLNKTLPKSYKKRNITISKTKPKIKNYFKYIKSISNKESDLKFELYTWATHNLPQKNKTLFFTKLKHNWKVKPSENIIKLPFSFRHFFKRLDTYNIFIDSTNPDLNIILFRIVYFIIKYFKKNSQIFFIKSNYDFILFKELIKN